MHRSFFAVAVIFFCLLPPAFVPPASAQPDTRSLPRIGLPPEGKLYHGAFPGDTGSEDEDPNFKDLKDYEAAVKKDVAWVYFSHFWYRGREFPSETAKRIRDLGAVPYVRLMLRSSWRQNVKEKQYSFDKILAGNFDEDLQKWAKAIKDFGTPVIAEWGTECNGKWFPWNGWWNGKGSTGGYGDPNKPDGPERFVAVYRHIIDIVRSEGADNVTWVFHVDTTDWPDKQWNRFENYYPGDNYVDWIAVSAYGPQTPMDDWAESFRKMMNPCYERIKKMAPGKPVIVAEFGCTHTSEASKEDKKYRADRWAGSALDDLFADRWPAVIGFSWWNEQWENDNNPRHDTNMRVQDWGPLKRAFRKRFRKNKGKLQTSPIVQQPAKGRTR